MREPGGKGELFGRGEPRVSTASRMQGIKPKRDWDHRECDCAGHQLPGERERIAFHVHQFEHGCYGGPCPESGRLYTAWQAALARAGYGLGT